MKTSRASVGVIGCGNMGSALIRGMLEGRVFPASRIRAWDPQGSRLKGLARAWGIRPASSNREAARSAVVLLAVKPQQMGQVLSEIRPHLGHGPLLVSIAAGIPTDWIEARAGGSIRVVRVMPNTPALVRCGVSALARGKGATSKDLRTVEKIFGGVGKVVRVKENLMDAVTAVSGSGPAYFFFLMEQMIQEAVRLGLPREAAQRLVTETARGAGELALQSGESPELLRARVTSKGGTTEAAFRFFARRQLGEILRKGIRAACRRAKQMRK
ncbi:MAG: pyrroline-5-carboxylate reductase [Candidatus Omnitrophica bacterium]|nr:pyrroline-5-carboxylate reductase [Candidatus Omnitrophota bacterium]